MGATALLLTIVFATEAAIALVVRAIGLTPSITAIAAIHTFSLAAVLSPLLWWRVIRPLHAAYAAERFLASIVESSDDAIMSFAPDGTILTWNRAAEAVFGHAAGDTIGQHVSMLIPADLLHELTSLTARVLEGHPVSHYEGWCLRKDGNRFWATVTLCPIRNAAGDVEAISIIGRDTSERLRAEQARASLVDALKESEERFRTLADGCPTMMWVTDVEGRNRFVNRTYLEFCGTTFEQVADHQWQPLIHPDDFPQYLTLVRRAVEQRAPFRAEARVRRGDGQWRLLDSSARPRFSPTGEFLGHAGVSEDITDRREAEEALRAGQQHHRLLSHALESAGDCICITDTDDRLVYVNQALLRTYGYEEHELLGQHIGILRSTRTPADTQASILPATLTGNWSGELWNRTRDGREFPIALETSAVIDENGQKTALVGIARDITDRKRYEEELIQARSAADAASVAKSRFLASMSHEIRTPMNGVIGMIQVLLTTDLTAEQRHYATVAQTSGRTLLALIDEILDLSKIEAGKMTLDCQSFDLRQAIDQVLEPLRLLARRKGLDIQARVSADLPLLLRGDAQRVRQVLNNLTANAIKFTERGRVDIDVERIAVADGTTTVRFQVTDTGIGIRPDQARTLFTPFVQADSSTTRKHGGTGLGLAICKQLVEMMGGTIGLESREGEGSTVWFTAVLGVPTEAVAANASDLPAPGESTPTGLRRDQRHAPRQAPAAGRAEACILIAEDEPTNRFVALAQLKKLGFRGDVVVNGAEAVEALQRGRYDLVLMDCEMPTMDGYEATRRIRALGHTRLPVIALTAHAMAGDQDRCLQAGMDDFLSKPVEMAQLARVLAKWLSSPAAPAAPEPINVEPMAR